MKTNNTTSNEIRSGSLILLSAITLIGLIFWSGNFQFYDETHDIHITFNYISGLEKNAPVHVAGHQIGKVTKIQFLGSDVGGVMITATVSGDIVLKQDAQAHLNIAGFMGEMFVELFTGSKDSPVLEPNQTLTGTDPIPLMELIKKGAELTERFEVITTSLEKLVASMANVVGENEDEMNNIFGNLDDTTRNLKEMTQDLKHHPWKLLRKGKEKTIEEMQKEDAGKQEKPVLKAPVAVAAERESDDEGKDNKKRFIVF